MAILAGSATGVQNFLQQLNTFLLSNGWNLLRGNPAVDPLETWFTYQGPGFDAIRRPYVHLRGITNTSSLSDQIEMRVAPSNNNSFLPPSDPVSTPSSVYTMVSLTGFEFRVYLDGLRILSVFRNLGSNYTTMYAGFFTPYAFPTEYPFPLICMGNSPDAVSLNFDTFRRPHIFDPISMSCFYRNPQETWIPVENRSNSTGSFGGAYLDRPTAFIYPFHTGLTNVANSASTLWPNSVNSNTGLVFHAFQNFTPTQQGELPMFPLIIVDAVQGAMGSLHNTFAIPSGGVLNPEQIITRGSETYRIFPNRDLRSGRDWAAVREV